jgi:radical SAM protein with 4Fe4S-binding SPASM domain
MGEPVSRKPRLVGWGITNRCNLSCPHCYSSSTKTPGEELTTGECFSILDSLAGLGTERIGWTGGEPLLRLDLESLVARGLERGIESGLTTNGIPMTARRAESLRKAGLKAIQISLDGSTSARNARIRGASAPDFDRVLRAIRLSQDAGFTVHMAMLVGRETLDDVRDYVDLASSMGVTSVRFCGFVPSGNGRRDDARGRLDLRGRLAELGALIEDLQERESPVVMFDPGFGPLPPDYDYHDCIAGMEFLYIAPSGDVYPCTSLLDERFRVGNLRRRSLEALWEDPAMTAVARYPKERITGACRECGMFERCHGACRGITYAYTGDMDASFPACIACADPGAGAHPTPEDEARDCPALAKLP